MAPSDGESRLRGHRRHRFTSNRSALLLALTACWIAAACQRAVPARDLTFEWTLIPAASTSAPAVVAFRIVDAAGRPVRGARLRLEAQMSHPGMAPVIAAATETREGRYEAALQLTMRGDWIVFIRGALATGEAVDHRIDLRDVRGE